MNAFRTPFSMAAILICLFITIAPSWAAMETSEDSTASGLPRALSEVAKVASGVTEADFQNDDFYWTRTAAMRARLLADAQHKALSQQIVDDPSSVLEKLDALVTTPPPGVPSVSANEYLDVLFYIKNTTFHLSSRQNQTRLIRAFFSSPQAFLSLQPGPSEIRRLQSDEFIVEKLRDSYSKSDWGMGSYSSPTIYAGLYYHFLIQILDSMPVDALLDVFLDTYGPYSLLTLSKLKPHQEIENARGHVTVRGSDGDSMSVSGIRTTLDTYNIKSILAQLFDALITRQASVQQLDRMMIFLTQLEFSTTNPLGVDRDFIAKVEFQIMSQQQAQLETRRDPLAYRRFLTLVRSPSPQSSLKIEQYLPVETTASERESIVQSLGEMLSNFEPQHRTVRNVSIYCKSIHCSAIEFTQVIRTLRQKHSQWIEHRTPTFERLGMEFVHTIEDYVALGALRWDAIAPYEEIARWIDNGMAYVKSAADYVTLMSKTPGSEAVLEGDMERFFALQPSAGEIEVLLSSLPEKSSLRNRMVQQQFPKMAESLQSAQSYSSWARLSLSATNPSGQAVAEGALRRSLSHFFELRPNLQQVNALATAVSQNPQIADLIPQIQKRAFELLIPTGIRNQGSIGIDLSDPTASALNYALLVRSWLANKSPKAADTQELVAASLPTFFQLQPDVTHINAVLKAPLLPALREAIRLSAIRQVPTRKALAALKLPFWFNQSAELKAALKEARLRIDSACARALQRD